VDALLSLRSRTKQYPKPGLGSFRDLEGIPFKYRNTDRLFYRSKSGRAVTGKRQLILQGMLRSVGTHGYERTTVQDAIAAAGLYRQAFYDDFENKEDCFLQAIDAGSAWIELAMREAANGETTWRRRLRGCLAGLLRFLDEQPEIGRALLVEVHAAGPRAVGKRTEAMERAAAMVDRAREESEEVAPAIAAEAVVAGILAVLHTRLAAEQTSGFELLLPELMYLAVLPYFGAAAAAAEMRASAT
jgi:AcrR family transcriptional regulator